MANVALVERGKAATSLNAVTASAAGNSGGIGDMVHFLTDPHGHLPNLMAIQTIIGGTGAFASFQIDLEGSLDGVNWIAMDSLTTVGGELSTLSFPVPYVRANLKAAVVGSGAPTLTVLFSF